MVILLERSHSYIDHSLVQLPLNIQVLNHVPQMRVTRICACLRVNDSEIACVIMNFLYYALHHASDLQLFISTDIDYLWAMPT